LANKSKHTDTSVSIVSRDRFVSASLNITTAIIVVTASILIGFSLYWNIDNLRQNTIFLAKSEAETHWNKDAAFRRWATLHGGVYVKPDERTPPNPYLAHLPNRDVSTTDGIQLTLMNPAYMMSQMTREFEKSFGVKGRITGKLQLNPANKPDKWEFEALTRFEQGAKLVVENTEIDGQPFLRYMKPMFMTTGCVKCHAVLGFKDGDLRGGVSVSIPLAPYFDVAGETINGIWITHGIVWLLAMFSVFLYLRFAKSRQRERIELLRQLEHDAVHDSLTCLPNRVLFTDRLESSIKRSKRERNLQFAVCFLDIDRFKNLNDSYGHRVGDKVLIQLAERFKEVIRPADTVARIGGDEFTFLLNDISGLGEAIVIAERILESMDKPFATEVSELYLNASIGLCMSNGLYQHGEEMLRDADIALYRAKASGKGRVDVFNKEMHDKAIVVMQMENDLRHALVKKQVEIYFQPVVDISKNTDVGFEALLRWPHPELGFIAPDEFIPIAEDTGMINDIGSWVIEGACKVVREWNLEFSRDKSLSLSVNLSGKQVVQHDIVASIRSIVSRTRFDPQLLHCEVTETEMIRHRERAVEVIRDLKALGIKISVDDFGKGYSSLTYLQEFDFDTLKIDKDFVQNMGAKGKGLQLVKTIMLLARDFNMNLVAEGVEEEDQLNRLRALGCKLIQGYYYSRPLAEKDMYSLLKQGVHERAHLLIESDVESPDQQLIPSIIKA